MSVHHKYIPHSNAIMDTWLDIQQHTIHIQCSAVITRSHNIHKIHSIACPWGSFVDQVSDWYSASVPVIIYVISHNIGQRYNGTRLYVRYGGKAQWCVQIQPCSLSPALSKGKKGDYGMLSVCLFIRPSIPQAGRPAITSRYHNLATTGSFNSKSS